MSLGRILLLLVVLAVGYWLFKSQAKVVSPTEETDSAASAPIQRARTIARRAEELHAKQEAAQREAEQGPDTSGGRVTENMTPEQVRRLLGPPDDITTETLEGGEVQERWTYRTVGKTVLFRNGIAIRVE